MQTTFSGSRNIIFVDDCLITGVHFQNLKNDLYNDDDELLAVKYLTEYSEYENLLFEFKGNLNVLNKPSES